MDAVGTLMCVRGNWPFSYVYIYFASTPLRADIIFERCTNAVVSPFGFTSRARLIKEIKTATTRALHGAPIMVLGNFKKR